MNINADETLQYLSNAGIISIEQVRKDIENMKKNKYLEMHQNPVWQGQGKDTRWKTRLPNGKIVAKAKKEDLENQTCQSLEEIFKDVEEIVENNKLNIPIFVAGGISQRSDVKHFFDLGVDGIQVATRFITTYECDASIKYKEAFLKARKEDIGFVSSPVGMPGRAMQNSFVKKTKKEKIPVKKCYQCLIPCDVKNTPYCISRALIEAVKGNLEDGLIFTGAHGYRQDHLMHVDEVIHELMEDDK